MSVTTDPNDRGINKAKENGQNESYLVLSDAEKAKGFVRPVRDKYVHAGEKPQHELRDLTIDEQRTHRGHGYVKYEEYPPDPDSSLVGRYWTQKQLDGGCGGLTTMALSIAATYARDPKFYGSTFCTGCGEHLPVGEFVWDGTEEVVGS